MIDDNSKQNSSGTLAEFISRQGPLEAKEAASILLQLVKDIRDLHSGGNIHRQICPNNIFIDEIKSVRPGAIETLTTIGGIGIDLIPCPPQFHNIPPISLSTDIKAAQQTLTKAGILLDPRQIDYYQLGALLCFMVSGHSISQYLRSCKAKADVPEEIMPVIDRALGLNFRDCFKSGDDFAADLQAIISGKSPSEKKSADIPDSIFDGDNLQTDQDRHSHGQLPFEKLGAYKIIEQIGCGGMGDVYKAHDKALDRFVAIKVLPTQLARQEDFVKRFHTEATAIARLEHPNVVSIYYSGQDQGHHFFAMQYVEGHSLAELLKQRGKLSIDEALPIIKQSLAGIGAAHRMGLIHRDIKPGNILLDSQSRKALITDFGVVKTGGDATQMTITGTVMGTADYIAPEQARGGRIDNRADLYAMGTLMYQMLSGKLPFEAESATSMMFQHAYEPVRPLSEVAPEVPDGLAEIILKLMNKEPQDRYQSTDDVLAAINRLSLQAGNSSRTSQTSIVQVPQYSLPPLPNDLSNMIAQNWTGRLKNRIKDIFCRHAPQVMESLQTTTQQVDGAVSQYQHQRDRLANLSKEADAVAADLKVQVKACQNAALLAGKRAELASDNAVITQALQEKQQNEQSASELSQLAAEQTEQAEEIRLRLAKLDTKLVQLRSQRDALNARMKAVGGHLPVGNQNRSRLFLLKLAAGVLVFIIAVLALMMLFTPRKHLILVQGPANDNGLIAHWKFDKGSGNIAHDSSGNNHGIIYGATWTDGISGGALSFDGTDDYVSCGSDASLDLTEFTWSLWIKRAETTYSNERALIATNGPKLKTKGTYGLQIDTSVDRHNRMQFVKHYTSVHGSIWSQTTIADTNWHFIALTRNSNGEAAIYIDGQPDTRGTIKSSSAFLDFTIGAGNINYGNFKGIIDDVRIYNRALSDAEVAMQWRASTKPSPVSDPVGTWQSVDFVKEIEYFRPGEKQWTGDLYLKGLSFYKGGRTSGPWTWENGILWHPGDKTKAHYVIKQIDGADYLFMEWMSGDVTIRGQKPSYYVMKKNIDPAEAIVDYITVYYEKETLVYADGLAVDGIIVRNSKCTPSYIESLIGSPNQIKDRLWKYTANSLDFWFATNGPLSEIRLNRGFKGRLNTGISLKSTKQQVFDTYGKPLTRITDNDLNRKNNERILYEKGDTSRIYYGKTGLIFWFRGNQINQIVVFKGRMKITPVSTGNIIISGTSNDDYMVLHDAAENGHLQTAKILIEKGANVNTRYASSYTPLHLAARNGHIETCLMLISKGANINARSKSDQTPLHLAAMNGHSQTVQTLIDKGADMSAKTASAKTPLQLANENDHSQTARILIANRTEISQLKLPENSHKTPEKTKQKMWSWWPMMEFIGIFGLMSIIFVVPILVYALFFKIIGIITKNPKCSYFRSLLFNFIFLLNIFVVHCLAVTLRRMFSIHSGNSIYFIIECVLTIACGTILFKKILSLKLILSIVSSTLIFFAQLGTVIYVIGNLFRM